MPVALTANQVAADLKRLGHYRVMRAGEVLADYRTTRIRQEHVLALGLRETHGLNVEGGAKWNEWAQRWEAQDDPTKMDVGWLQISRRYHPSALRNMVGVRNGTWDVEDPGKTANDSGYVPRFTDSTVFTVQELRANIQYFERKGVPEADLLRIAIAAHNAGRGGAWTGYQNGNVDANTAMGNYSADVLRISRQVRQWLDLHPNWSYDKRSTMSAVRRAETKPGTKTTEFALTVAFVVLSIVQEAVGVFNIHDATVLKGQAFVVGLYALARGWAKTGVPYDTDPVPGDLTNPPEV